MRLETVSKIYAKALFLSAKESSDIEAVLTALKELVHFMDEQKAFSGALLSEAFSYSEKQKLIAEFLKKANMNNKVSKLFELLVSKKRTGLLGQVLYMFERFVDDEHGIVRGEVLVASALSEAEQKELEAAFSKKLNKQVILNSKVDIDVLGGLVVNIQGKTFDGSLKTAIHKLKENLERQAQ